MDAKQQAMGIRTGVRSEVMAEFKKEVLVAKEGSLQELEDARQKITAETEVTRKVLLREAEILAGEIAGKLMGRPL
jgi:F0F1-type ATP synthase membrane subunit b/b'